MTGWTWDYVEHTLTIPRLKSLHEEWRRHPPLSLLVASYLGYKPQEYASPDDLVRQLAGLPITKIL
jgi:hypothetical protein